MLFSSGDALAQQVVDRRGWAKHDLARSGRMALYGGGRFIQSSPMQLNRIVVVVGICLFLTYSSNLWTGCYGMVWLSSTLCCDKQQGWYYRGQSGCRPSLLCPNAVDVLPVVHGYHGGHRPYGEVAHDLHAVLQGQC